MSSMSPAHPSGGKSDDEPSDAENWSTQGRLCRGTAPGIYKGQADSETDDDGADTSSKSTKKAGVKPSARSKGKQSTIRQHFQAARSRERSLSVKQSMSSVSRSNSRRLSKPPTQDRGASVTAGPSNAIRGGTRRPSPYDPDRPNAERIQAAA
ncbi:hypothetical protein CYLTODRAFT_460197, partial [Cylindrobasidium torrendii FP15055 ss-10]